MLATRVVDCDDNFEQLSRLPDASVDLNYVDPAPVGEVELPFNSNRSREAIWEVYWGETKAPMRDPSKTATLPRKLTSNTCVLGYTKDPDDKCRAFYKRIGRIIKLRTVQETLNEGHILKMWDRGVPAFTTISDDP